MRSVSRMRPRPFGIDAIVILPDHLHCLWTLPPGDADYSVRWARIKQAFSRRIPWGERRRASRIAKRERGLWQRRCWEHSIADSDDLKHHVDYIHYNPVKHGHVDSVVDWPHSSFHRYVRMGVYPPDWAGSRRATISKLWLPNDLEGASGGLQLIKMESKIADDDRIQFELR
jgi:putative transposase